MIKKLTTAAVTTAGLLLTTTPTFAAGLCANNTTTDNFADLCNLNLNTGNAFGNIITIIFIIATILALVYLIWGGIKWVLSGGDKAKVDAARAAIVASIVGLIIVFLSYFILNVVVGLFIKDFSLNNITLPTVNGGGSVSCASHGDPTSCGAAGCSWSNLPGDGPQGSCK